MPKIEIFLRASFLSHGYRPEELFNHGIEGERLAGESLLAKASVTGHNFVEIETLHMAKTRILLLRVDLGTSLLACFMPFFLSFANREKTAPVHTTRAGPPNGSC